MFNLVQTKSISLLCQTLSLSSVSSSVIAHTVIYKYPAYFHCSEVDVLDLTNVTYLHFVIYLLLIYCVNRFLMHFVYHEFITNDLNSVGLLLIYLDAATLLLILRYDMI